MRKLISSSRYIVIVPVIACLVATTVLMVYGAIQTGIEIFGMISAVPAITATRARITTSSRHRSRSSRS